jgi:hypothetical protein
VTLVPRDRNEFHFTRSNWTLYWVRLYVCRKSWQLKTPV